MIATMCIFPVRVLELLHSHPIEGLVPEKSEGERQGALEGMRLFLSRWKPTGDLSWGGVVRAYGRDLGLCSWAWRHYEATCQVKETRAKKGDSRDLWQATMWKLHAASDYYPLRSTLRLIRSLHGAFPAGVFKDVCWPQVCCRARPFVRKQRPQWDSLFPGGQHLSFWVTFFLLGHGSPRNVAFIINFIWNV